MANKKKNKEKEQQPKQKKSVQRLFRADRQKEKEREGWKKITATADGTVKMTAKGDLILMEKDV